MIKNYTTEVSEEKTVGEIVGLLSGKGARSVRIDYDEQNRPSAVSFILLIESLPIPFKLPCNFEGVMKAISREFARHSTRYRWERKPSSIEQSRRVAWRIIKDWVAAQMALIEAEQANMAQVFLPYAIPNEKTQLSVYDQFMQQILNQKQLGYSVANGDSKSEGT